MKATKVTSILLGALLLTATWAGGADDKSKTPAGKLPAKENRVVDSGSFGIFLAGRRVGTETFKIEERADFSIATAELKVDDGATQATQTAEMQITPKGELRSYVWHSISPVKEEASVEPNDQLLMEHLVPADMKKTDVPHVLPLSTVILDDNFFSQREILLWRYLAGCTRNKDQNLSCGPSSFGILVPHQHQAGNATLELQGLDKTTIKGVERQLNKVLLKTGDPQHVVMSGEQPNEPGQWMLWVDDQYKVVKMTVTGANVEIVRD